ncbi:acetate/propionate family kinase [Patescibacteria group bacterium]|nr:acetate/propionate family kinase [Patescibacteria group bacterium]
MKYILVINSGSATLKCKVFEVKSLQEKFKVIVERVGLNRSFLVYSYNRKEFKINFTAGLKDHRRVLKEVIKILPYKIYKNIRLIGHRVVHGGKEFIQPTILNNSVIKKLRQYHEFASLHNPINFRCIEAAFKEFPQVRQVAVFDTGFFKDLAPHVFLYALPIKYYRADNIRKYGFHGLSHENMYEQAVKKTGKAKLNLITCHLGSGSSITAIKAGKVLDTSMGFSPLAGVVMGSRCGDIDPYIPLYLAKNLKMTAEQINQELNFNSGFVGLFGTQDLREILAASGVKVTGYRLEKKYSKVKKRMAKLTLDIFIYSVQKYVASYAGLLGKVEAVVFSGGIGERSEFIRKQILQGVNFLHKPKVYLVKANEEAIIAKKIKKFVS